MSEKLNPHIIQYIRRENRTKRGVCVAVKCNDGVVRYGVSICNQLDKFDPKHGFKIAYRRALLNRPGADYTVQSTADAVHAALQVIAGRAEQYFKPEPFQQFRPFSSSSLMDKTRNF